ncbi:MAG: FAD:protein FMN transferase [Myxococcales bacterium]|nr:FAD:protein FMN transferase [Myxococcales bacterium]
MLLLVGLSAVRLLEPVETPSAAVFTGATMGTTYSVKLADKPAKERSRAITKAIAEALERTDRTASTYRDDSELARFNRHADSGAPFEPTPALRTMFEIALDIGQRSGGALDVTVGPLVNAWGFGPETRKVPDAEMLAALQQRVGLHHLRMDQAGLHKSLADLTCDLSAIAKGYAVDQVVSTLERLGQTNFLVEIGGELRGRGRRPDGQPWHVGIEKPLRELPGEAPRHRVERVVRLSNLAMATSGDYRNYLDSPDGPRPHLIDPRTGRPIEHALASVTVLHHSTARADGWATALGILGPSEGPTVARREGLAAFFIVRTGAQTFRSITTPAFDRLAGATEP